ncbi:MAG: phosphate signaling complex protein PhoU [Oscillospiraceae bacterium]|nr:phosphate signaling complex protein PhoU [Oscillospiraceae bacterium]
MSSTRTKFDRQLSKLNDSLIQMSKMVESAIHDAVRGLVEQNVELANKAIGADEEIDGMEKEIESLCLDIILRQQPVAGDLRAISAVLKIITDLERIGDHATDISEITIFLSKSQYMKKLVHIPKMAEETMNMLSMAIDSFVNKDVSLAKKVIAADDIVDDLFVEVKQKLIEMIKQDVEHVDQSMDFMMVAKYFERIGDHAVNIAEWVVFSLTGIHKDIKIM